MEWFPTPNYEKGRSAFLRLIVIHCSRSGIPGNDDWPSTINHFANPYPTKPQMRASSHRLYDTDGTVGAFVDDMDTAWHAGYLNPRSLGAENCQPTIDTPFTILQITALAADVRRWCETYGIPKVRVFDEKQAGIIGHEDTAQGKACGKTDPGYLFPWTKFLALLEDDMATVAGAILDLQEEVEKLRGLLHLAALALDCKLQELADVLKALGVVAK